MAISAHSQTFGLIWNALSALEFDAYSFAEVWLGNCLGIFIGILRHLPKNKILEQLN